MRSIPRLLGVVALAATVLAGASACATSAHKDAGIGAPGAVTTPTVTPTPRTTSTPKATSAFNKKRYSISKASSPWVVVNKLRPLNPKTFAPHVVTVPVAHDNPAQMQPAASAALVTMFAAAKKEGGGAMQVQSSYRSYSVQVSVYNGWVARLGKEQADRQSARPGYSEHQTGLAVDISSIPLKCTLAACFGTTTQGKWLAKNAYRFGYLLRYPQGLTRITGYEYEPWHFRYIGVALATEMHKEGVKTLEGFFGLPDAPDYK